MTFPTPYTVGWHHHSDGDDDGYGETADIYTPPLVDVHGTPVAGAPTQVHGWAPPGARGNAEPDPERVIHDLDLFVPITVESSPKDIVDLPVGRFEVVGWPLDYTHGPFSPGFGGLVVRLKKVTR